MDENKRQTLKDIGYQIRHVCASCKYANLTGHWGTCFKHKYQHLKHTDEIRYLSIHSTGHCPDYTEDPQFEYQIHGFKEFKENWKC